MSRQSYYLEARPLAPRRSFVNVSDHPTPESTCTCLKWVRCCLGGGGRRAAGLRGSTERDSPYRAPKGGAGGGGGMARLGREFQC